MAKLGGHHAGWPATVAYLGGDRRLVTYLQRQTGSVGYMVNRKAAASYVDKLLPMRVPYDHEFDRAWKYGIRVRGIVPSPVTMAGSASTISRRKYAGSKFNRRLYKAGVELARLRHYLFSDVEWMKRPRATRSEAKL
jgi:glycosyl transferase family 25